MKIVSVGNTGIHVADLNSYCLFLPFRDIPVRIPLLFVARFVFIHARDFRWLRKAAVVDGEAKEWKWTCT